MSTQKPARMFMVVSLITAQTWKQPRCPSVSDLINKLGTPRNRNIQHSKIMSYQVMKRHGGNLNAYN